MSQIKIQKLNKNSFLELALLMSWRSNPLIYRWFLLQDKPLEWQNHLSFLNSEEHRDDYMVYLDERPIGHVSLSKKNLLYPEISIMIGEISLWGRGFSNTILRNFLEILHNQGYTKLSARISNDNVSSIKLFNRNGFYYVDSLVDLSDWSLYHYSN